MKDLLILPFLAFVIASAALDCADLKSQFTFDEVSDCTQLKALGSTLQLNLKDVDDTKWEKLRSKLIVIKNVDIVIESSSITKIDLPSMSSITNSQITVKNNPLLQSVNFATDGETTLNGLTIADNPKLEKFKMAAPPKKFDIQSKKIEISNNRMLKDVDIPIGTNNKPGGVEVKGNRHLSSSTLQKFKDLGLSDHVQDEGECVFTKKIEDLGELKDCKYVEGDLKLANDVKGDAGETKLTRVGGDVDLGNLPKDKASFLKSTDVKGKTSGGSDGGSGGDSKKSGNSGGMGMGLIIGIIAGVVVVVLIVTVIAVYCYLKKKKSGKGKKGKPAKKGKPTDEQTTTFEGDTGGGKKKKKGADKKKKAQSPAAASASQSASVATTPDPLNPGKNVPLRDDGIDLDSEDDGPAKKKSKK